MTAPVRVAHLVQGLEVGGLEMMVVSLVEGLDRARYTPIVCCYDTAGTLTQRLAALGIEWHLLPRRPGVDLGYIFKLARLFRSIRADIVHLHNPTAFFYGALAGRLAGVRGVIYTEHGRDFSASYKVRWANRLLSRLVDRIVVVADFGRRYLVEKEGVAPGKIVTVRNGIDAAPFGNPNPRAVRDRLEIGVDVPLVGIVARLAPIKNHELLIRAMRQVADAVPRAQLLVIGDGSCRAALEALVALLHLGDRVRFLGERSDVPDLLQALDVFVLCSHSEGLSLTLVEACAAGRAIVATDVGGNGEVVERGVNGLLVPSNDEAALAQALIELLKDPERRARMGQQGRARFEREFTLAGMVRAYEDLYRNCARRG